MKVLVVAPEYGDSPYAASLRYEGLCRELIPNPHIVVEVVSGIGKPTDTKLNWHRSLNINARVGSMVTRTIKEVIFGLLSSILVAVRRPDFVILSVPNFISSLLIGSFCKAFRIQYFLDTRDLYPATYVLGGLVSEDGYFYKGLNKLTGHLYRGAAHHFSATKGLASEIQRLFDVHTAPSVIMNGYPGALCNEISATSPEPERDVVMHGTFGRMQNVGLLLEVVRSMPHTTFTFIGEGPFFQQVRDVKLKNLVVHSRLAHRDVLQLVAQHRVGLSVRSGSWYDTMSLPVKIFEFLGLGLNVVSYPKTEFDDDAYAKARITNVAVPAGSAVTRAITQALCSVEKNRGFQDSGHLSRECQSEAFSEEITSYLTISDW